MKHQSKLHSKKCIDLTGSSLTPEEIWAIIDDRTVRVSIEKNLAQVKRSYDFLHKCAEKQIIYGVNTGFGPMANRIIDKHNLETLQKNLVRSHACGVGKPIREEFVLAAMVVRLNTLVKGVSGVSVPLLRQLEFFINHRIIPVIPEHGAVGTSGDLVQLAHIALALIGEGEVVYKGVQQPTARVFKGLKIKPHVLEIKEGISLINGTSAMTGITTVLLDDIMRLTSFAHQLGAFALEIIGSYSDSISGDLHALRPHAGQIKSATILRALLTNSKRLQDRYGGEKIEVPDHQTTALPKAIQDVYSFRCIAQVVGPLIDSIASMRKIITTEMNSATDNPLIDTKNKTFLHGGNFHGDYIATAVDQIKIPLIKSTLMSERRINYLLDEKVNGIFPPFLNLNTPGLTLGLQGLQFVATSTAAENQTLAFPHSLHTISTNGSNQDIVSMGTDAALLVARIIENSYVIFTIELVALLQASDVVGDLKNFSPASQELYRSARKIFPTVKDDRSLSNDVCELVKFLKSSRLNEQSQL